MSDKITDIPDVPQKIIEAVNHRKLAVFIGAGVSRLVGCWSWEKLAKKLIEKCFDKDVLNYKEKESVLQSRDHRQIITIAYNLLKKDEKHELFYECMEEALMFGKNEIELKGSNIYDKIIKLRGTFFTTNADVLFDNKFIQENIYVIKADFIPGIISEEKENKLFHIHGSIKDRDSLVFTLSQYLTRYSNNNFRNFLKTIFNYYTVLFLGYGLMEFQLLEFIFEGESTSLKHYMLEPFYFGEDNLLKLSQLYYDELGIEVIGYEKDKKGYKQLESVLDKWGYEINKNSSYVRSSFTKIDDAVNNFTSKKALTAIQLIKNDNGQFTYFLEEVAKHPDIINWLKPLKDTGFFNPNDNPDPIKLKDRSVKNWRILNYLEYAARENSEKQSPEISDIIIERIDKIIESNIMNPSTNRKILKIMTLLPVEKITQTHICFVRNSLEFELDKVSIEHEISESFVPYLIRHRAKHKAKILILELIQVLLSYKKKEYESYKMYITSLDNYHFRRIIGRFKKEIADICGLETLNIGIKKIEEFIKTDHRQFMKSKFESLDLDDTTSEREHSAQLIFFVLIMLEELAPSLIRNKIENFLKANDLIFRRLAIHAINHHYQELSDLFWNINENLLNEYDLKLELYELLNAKAEKFDNDQVSKVLSWIENADYLLPVDDDIDEEQKEKILAYRKKEWLTALLNSKHPEVINLFDKYNRINPEDVKHPGHSFWIETGVASSPKSVEELLSMDNKEIVEYCKEKFKPSLKNEIIAPTAEGLSTNLRQSVTDRPEKFSDDLLPFLEVPDIYINSIIYGFYEACKRNNEFYWNKVIEFIQKFIQNKSIPVKIQTLGKIDYKKGTYSGILSLLEEGLKNENYTIDDKLMPKVEDILFAIDEICESAELFNPDDMISSLINSQKGKLYITILEYSIRYAILNKGSKQRWKNSIKEYFTEILNSPEDISWEFYVSAGSFLNYLYYLDKDWITKNINRIFPKEHEKFWLYAMQGYLSHFNLIHDDIYNLLKVEGHYNKVINMDDCDKEIVRGVVQHICVGLHHNWERLDDEESLISVLLNKEKANHLKEIVWYYRSFIKERKTLPEIKPLWKKIFEICKNHIDENEFKVVAADVWEWVNLVDVVDEEVVDFLKLSCKYLDSFYQAGKFVEFLSYFVVNEPQKAGELFLAMVDNNVIPRYEQKDIRNAINLLFEKGEKEVAKRICNIYAMNGLGELVRDIMEKYFPSE